MTDTQLLEQRIKNAAQGFNAAKNELEQALLEGYRAGLPKTQLAELSGRSRPYIYSLLGKGQGKE